MIYPSTSTPGHHLNFEWEVREQRTTTTSNISNISFSKYFSQNLNGVTRWPASWPGPRDCMIHVGSCGTKAIVACIGKPLIGPTRISTGKGFIKDIGKGCLNEKRGVFHHDFLLGLHTKTPAWKSVLYHAWRRTSGKHLQDKVLAEEEHLRISLNHFCLWKDSGCTAVLRIIYHDCLKLQIFLADLVSLKQQHFGETLIILENDKIWIIILRS